MSFMLSVDNRRLTRRFVSYALFAAGLAVSATFSRDNEWYADDLDV